MAQNPRAVHKLEKEVAELRGQLSAMLAAGARSTNKPMVGLRNISSYTIGLVNHIPGEEGEVQLYAAVIGAEPDPLSCAVISYAFWKQVRVSKQYLNGMLVRDDSVLAASDTPAQEDRPGELPASAVVNQVPDPVAWIESKTDAELRSAINAMTSEQSLRRLLAAVDWKIHTIGEAYADAENRAERALRELPGAYRTVDELAMDRLTDFSPNRTNYEHERKTSARI